MIINWLSISQVQSQHTCITEDITFVINLKRKKNEMPSVLKFKELKNWHYVTSALTKEGKPRSSNWKEILDNGEDLQLSLKDVEILLPGKDGLGPMQPSFGICTDCVFGENVSIYATGSNTSISNGTYYKYVEKDNLDLRLNRGGFFETKGDVNKEVVKFFCVDMFQVNVSLDRKSLFERVISRLSDKETLVKTVESLKAQLVEKDLDIGKTNTVIDRKNQDIESLKAAINEKN